MSKELQEFLQSLVGQTCWASIAGLGTGSIVSLYFGEKILRHRPVENPYLSSNAQRYDGEYVLFIQESAWRIESSERVLCSSLSSNQSEGAMQSSLRLLEGKRVIDLELNMPSLDFVLGFESGLSLRAFNFHETYEELDNYSISNKDKCMAVLSTGDVVVERKHAPLHVVP